MKALGILGGSFDPIHNGHTMIAHDVYEKLDLEQVIFMPAYIAPHKIGCSFASPLDRYKMTELAIADVPYFCVSDVEFQKAGISYTVDTMRIIKKMFPLRDLFFIIGADSIPELETWHNIDELFSLVKFAAVYRVGYDEKIAIAKKKLGNNSKKIIMVQTPEYDISSTLIRDKVKMGQSIKGMVAPQVEKYILQKGLYR